jgi:hypothetical protein
LAVFFFLKEVVVLFFFFFDAEGRLEMGLSTIFNYAVVFERGIPTI